MTQETSLKKSTSNKLDQQTCERKKRKSIPYKPVNLNNITEDYARIVSQESQDKIMAAVKEVQEAQERSEEEEVLHDLCSRSKRKDKNCCCKITGKVKKKSHQHKGYNHLWQPVFDSSLVDSSTIEGEIAKMTKLLRSKPPPLRPKDIGCKGINEDQYDSNDIPWIDKASCPHATKIQKIFDRFPMEEGVLPPVALPVWRTGGLPLTCRVPQIQALLSRYLTWTRGKMCHQLQTDFHLFTLEDPRRSPGPYNALNDPGTRNYFNAPHVRCLLYKQKFINDFDEVVCTMKEFNDYREYIRLQTKNRVHEVLKSRDEQEKYDREQLRRIKEQLKKEANAAIKDDFWGIRAERNRRMREDTERFEIWKTQTNIKNKEATAAFLQRQKKIDAYHRAKKSEEAKEPHKTRLRTAQAVDNFHKASMLTKIITKEVGLGIDRQKEQIAIISEKREIWKSRALQQDKRKLAEANKKNKIRAAITEQVKHRIALRKAYFEKEQKKGMVAVQKRHAEKERILRLTRKYFDIWRNNTRRNIERSLGPQDGLHDTVWGPNMENGLAKWTKQLKGGKTVPRDFRDSVWHVMKLKADNRWSEGSNDSDIKEDPSKPIEPATEELIKKPKQVIDSNPEDVEPIQEDIEPISGNTSKSESQPEP